ASASDGPPHAFDHLLDAFANSARPAPALAAALPDAAGATPQAEEEGFFDHLLDVVNPMQHIPVVSNFYREYVDDPISAVPRILGGALFGGPIGAASAAANAVLDWISGDDLGGHVIALFRASPAAPETLAEKPDAAPAPADNVSVAARVSDAPGDEPLAGTDLTMPNDLAAVPAQAVADRMMTALDKYQQMMRERARAAEAARAAAGGGTAATRLELQL
ncbi:MAG: hypothetical protein RIC93_03540, partial [Alphaproteobacteria bacterium]